MNCLTKNIKNEYMGASFHHIGVACQNIEITFANLMIFFPSNIQCSEIIFDSKLNANLQLIKLGDQCFIELVSGKIVENILKKQMFLYHTCFEVDHISDFNKKLKQQKFIPLTSPTPADLFDGRLVQFFQTPMGIVEILEKS
jgi:methylmalonyl-CoA/ethylmalonyl-CoA epimerase